MTETVRFVDTVSYTEADQADFNMRMMRPQGIIPESLLGTLVPSAIGSMAVRIGPGEAFIQGFQYKSDANKDLTIGANASGSTRIDYIVLRMDRTGNTMLAVVVVGTPGAGAPALTQVAGGTWEFPIAQITVVNGASSIVSGNIADGRVFSRWSRDALGAGVKLQTDYALTTDINGVALTVNAWNSIASAAALTVDRTGSLVAIDVQASAWVNNASGSGNFYSWRVLIDGVTSKLMGGGIFRDSTKDNIHNPFIGAATAWIPGLAAGAHTVQLQINPDATATTLTFFCRPATVPREFLQIQVTEHMQG